MTDFVLPDVWSRSAIQDFCLVIQGQSPPGDTYNITGEGHPFFQGKAEFGRLYPTVAKWCTAPTKFADADDILISVRAPVGPTNLCRETVGIGRGLAAVRPRGGVLSRYILYALRYSKDEIAAMGTGSTFTAISGEQLRTFQLPLAPVAEQARIVEAIETQFSRLDAATAALERARANLKRYRAAVLNAACSGRLVPTEADSRRLINLTIADLIREPLANGRSVPDAKEGFPVLRLTALKNGRIDTSASKIGDWSEDQARRFLIAKDDFMVARGNGSIRLVGRGGLVENSPDSVAFPDTMIRLRLDTSKIVPRFLRIIWDAGSIRKQIESTARTTAGIHKINQQDIASMVVPVPPLAEQHRIVAEVERRLSVVERMEAEIAAGLRRAERLRQAILHRAFTGRLVPQDPNDEPAAALLDRIRAAGPPRTGRPRG